MTACVLAVIAGIVALTMALIAGYQHYEQQVERYAPYLPVVSAVVLITMDIVSSPDCSESAGRGALSVPADDWGRRGDPTTVVRAAFDSQTVAFTGVPCGSPKGG